MNVSVSCGVGYNEQFYVFKYTLLHINAPILLLFSERNIHL